MFSTERLIADCRKAMNEHSPDQAIKEIAKRAVSDPAGVARALGTPQKGELIMTLKKPSGLFLTPIKS